MKTPTTGRQHPEQPLKGLLSATGAFLTWGLTPIYFKALAVVPAFQILLHRIIWSFVLLLTLLWLGKRWQAFTAALRNGRTLLILMASTTVVAVNWFLFIWAINSNHILQTSLGYYINPLVNVVLGLVFLKERLRRLQVLAVLLAGAGVLYLTLHHGRFPWVALTLAVSFGCYGLIRKVAPVEALEGLAVETLLLSLPAVAGLLYLERLGSGAFLHHDWRVDLLLAGTAFITAVPLLLFTTGARLLPLRTMGFLQYLAPSCTFLLAVLVYHEPFAREQLLTFLVIWTALALYSLDAVITYRKTQAALRACGKH
jgi:chloramphenicol-sensitive protein RarD